MMESVEVQHDITAEVVDSIVFTQEGRDADGNLLLSEMMLRFQSGATLHVTPGSDKTFLVSTSNPRREP